MRGSMARPKGGQTRIPAPRDAAAPARPGRRGRLLRTWEPAGAGRPPLVWKRGVAWPPEPRPCRSGETVAAVYVGACKFLFFFSLIIVIVLRLNLRIFLHLEGPALNGLEGARSPSAAGSRVPEALILQSLLSCQSWPRILLTSGFHPVSPSYPSPHLLLQDSTSDSLSKSCPEEIGSG